jgi:hypothetical protein
MTSFIKEVDKIMTKHYYEINFYGEGHKDDYSWYIKNQKSLTDNEVKEVLKKDFLGNGVTQEMMNNIVLIQEIDSVEFTLSCGIKA